MYTSLCGGICFSQSDIAESILEETSLEDKDVDTIINILQSLSLLRGSVSSLNATVDIVFNLVDLLVFNPSLVDISRGQVSMTLW